MQSPHARHHSSALRRDDQSWISESSEGERTMRAKTNGHRKEQRRCRMKIASERQSKWRRMKNKSSTQRLSKHIKSNETHPVNASDDNGFSYCFTNSGRSNV